MQPRLPIRFCVFMLVAGWPACGVLPTYRTGLDTELLARELLDDTRDPDVSTTPSPDQNNSSQLDPQPKEHPLASALRMAEASYKTIQEEVKDYTATLVKRERVGDSLDEDISIFAKIRHQQKKDGNVLVPFSVYLKFRSPEKTKGREVIYVAGRNEGRLLAQESPMTITGMFFGTTALKPTGMLAMRGNRYPITQIGIKNLTRRLILIAKSDMKFAECKVRIIEDTKVGDRTCRCFRVEHPVPRKHFRFHIANVYVDKKLNVPIRYQAFDWPKRAGEKPLLTEQYSYRNLKLNVGLTDADFDHTNPKYKFK